MEGKGESNTGSNNGRSSSSHFNYDVANGSVGGMGNSQYKEDLNGSGVVVRSN